MKKSLIALLIVVIAAGVFGGGFYYYKTKKQTKAPVTNQQVNPIQEENANEVNNNTENTNDTQSNVENGNQGNIASGNQEVVPKGKQKYSYNQNGVNLSFLYPNTWDVQENNNPPADYGSTGLLNRFFIDGTGQNSNGYSAFHSGSLTSQNKDLTWIRFDLRKKDGDFNIDNWVNNMRIELGGNMFEDITTKNGLAGYRLITYASDHSYQINYFFKGEYLLTVANLYWTNDSEKQDLQNSKDLIDSIDFN